MQRERTDVVRNDQDDAPAGPATTDGSTPITVSARVVAVVAHYLDDVTARTHRRLGEVAGVAVTMATEVDGPLTAGASSALAREVDALQYAIGHGPCLAALRGAGAMYVPDLGRDHRWGEYGPRAAAIGARSCLSLPVVVDDVVLAVAKVYSGRVDGLDEDQQRLGREAALEITGGVALARLLGETATELDDRISAMDHRRTIDLALGILMERTGCDADQAFDLLRRYSQNRNEKLSQVALDLVEAAVGRQPTTAGSPKDQLVATLLASPATEAAGAGRVSAAGATGAPFIGRGTPPGR